MGRNPIFNQSGCKDLTAHLAISNVEKERKRARAELKKLFFGHACTCQMIRNFQEEIYRLGHLIKAERDTLKAITYHEIKSQKTNAIADPTAQAVTNIIDKYEAQIKYTEQRLNVLYSKKEQVEAYLDSLEIQEQELIELRYFKKMPWWKVACQMDYSERHCKRMDNELLNKLAQI